jgi:ABC-type branched-subunit amino acid transport system substrate-binding protein
VIRSTLTRCKFAVVVAAALCFMPLAGFSSAGASIARVASISSLNGAPIKIGFIDVEDPSASSDFQAQRTEAQQLVGYLNSQGGVEHHPIQLITCVTVSTSGGATCANRMVLDKVVLVIGNSVINSAPVYPILKSAGIPFFGGGVSPLDAADLTPDGNHWFVGAGALVQYILYDGFIADHLKEKNVGVLVASTAAAQQAASNFVEAPLKAAGVSTQVVNVSEANPDFTSAVDTIMNTDALVILLDCTQQDLVIKQARTLGYKGAILGCLAPTDLKAIGTTDASGVYGATPTVVPTSSSSSSAVRTYLTLAHRYGWNAGTYDVGMYAQLLSAIAFIKSAGGPSATGATVAAAIEKATNVPVPLGPPAGLTCSKVLSKLAPTACNVQEQFVQVTKSGSLKPVSAWMSPPSS